MAILDEIRDALDNQKLTMENLGNLDRQQHCRVVQHVLNRRLPFIIHTERGDLTITSIVFSHDRLNIYGNGVIKDPGTSDDTWHVTQNRSPIWVRDDSSTDRLIEHKTGEIFGYRLDPIQAMREMIMLIVRQQS